MASLSQPRQLLFLLALVVLVRLPFLNHPIQGDDTFYLSMAMRAQIDPLHPTNFKLIAEGMEVDMRGFPHPPLNAWMLAGLLAVFGDVREVPLHASYIVFSLIAVAAMWSLAVRFNRSFENGALWATFLFVATPAFLVNGNSLESDLPFLAFWLAATALFVRAVDARNGTALVGAALAFALAALTAYQAVVLSAISAVYLWERRRNWIVAWAALATPFAVLGAWQLWTRATTGEMPAAVLAGYFDAYGLQRLANKARNAVALTVHLGWVVFPLLAWMRRRWWLALLALPAIALDWHPLFWLSLAAGIFVLARAVENVRPDPDRRFLASWILIFFAACLAIFFAGSARYLLPLAAPVAILAARQASQRMLAACFAAQLAVSLGLAVVNYQHWNGYREFVASVADRFVPTRVWINGEWGLRFYAEAAGGLPMLRGQAVRPGDLVIASELNPLPLTTGGGTPVELARREIGSTLPMRLIAVNTKSAWSNSDGVRPFDLSVDPIDTVRLSTIAARAPALSYLPMNAPEVESQAVSGIHQLDAPGNAWRWTAGRFVAVLKAPPGPATVEATFRIHDAAAGARVSLSVDGTPAAADVYTAPGNYTLRAASPATPSGPTVSVVLTTDKSFRVPGDHRELGVILTGIGFR